MKKIITILFLCLAFNINAQNAMGTNNADSSRYLIGNFTIQKMWEIKDSTNSHSSWWFFHSRHMRFKPLRFIDIRNNDTINRFVLSNAAGYIHSINIDSLTNFKNIRDSIRNRYTKLQVDNKFITQSAGSSSFTTMQSQVNGKMNSPTGTNLQYIAGDGSFITMPTNLSAFTNGPGYLTSVTYSNILGLPTLFSGAYNDLSGKPTLFSGIYSDLTGKPALFSGSYLDLTNKPSIPASQVNSDWNSVSGLSEILNKPSLFSGVYSDLTSKPTLFSGSYVDLTGKPTIPTNNNQLTNGNNYISSYIPTLTIIGNSLGIYQGNTITLPSASTISITAGNNVTVTTSYPNFTINAASLDAPSFNNAITSGTAFQPDANNDCFIIVSSSLVGSIVGVYGTSVLSISTTQSGTYTNVGAGVSFFLNILAAGDNRESSTIPVKKGQWVKVINTATGLGGSLASTYTKWSTK